MIDYIIPPVVGGLIGYWTNWLAIKMIFRPFEPKYILGHRLPFTPGLIPRNREDIVRKISQTIAFHLLNPDRMYRLFDNNSFKDSLHKTADKIVDRAMENITESLKKQITQETSIQFIQNFLNNLSDKLKEKVKSKIQHKMSESIETEIDRYLKEDFITVLKDLDVEGLIYQTLMEVDIQTLEDIILGFSKKQLRYITNLGGVIGFFIGLAQAVMMMI